MRLGEGTLKFNGESVNCRLYSQIQNLFKLSLTENVVIPPSSEMIIPTKIVGDQPVGKTAVVKDVCPSLSKKGNLVGKSVFDPNKCEYLCVFAMFVILPKPYTKIRLRPSAR